MKVLTVTILFGILSEICLAQTKGYKTIEIGKTIRHVYNVSNYQISVDREKPNTYYISSDTIKICNTTIDHFEITTAPDSTIIEIKAYSKDINFTDYYAFRDYFGSVLKNMVNTVGKSDYGNLGQAEKVAFAWTFDTGVMLALRFDNDMPTDAKNFKRNFLFIWDKLDSKQTHTMW